MRWLLVAALITGCGDDGSSPTRVRMDRDREGDFFSAPFPSDDLRTASGVDVSGFPNPEDALIVEQVRALLDGQSGFATTGGVFFALTGPIDETSLPTIAESVTATSPVFLVGIEPGSPDHGKRYPVEVEFEPVANLYAADNTISLLPVQGVPLLPATRYAAVITTDVIDAAGTPLAPASLQGLDAAVAELAALGVAADRIAGLTVFTTADQQADFVRVRDAALARGLPAITTPFQRTDLFDDFCVYQATIAMPDYQSGEPPYSTEGGTWEFDAGGNPVLQREAPARLVVTLPRSAPPAAGYPAVVFVRVGGGGDRPMVDRGKRAEPGGPSIEPGEGPARYFARAGFAGVQVDGPHGGPRGSGGDEQFAMFNVQNLGAIRDNIRQTAIELVVLAHVIDQLTFDALDCPPANTSDQGPPGVSFDTAHLALMGHSMGATVAPLAAAHEPMFAALILSGAGGSWIENIVYKRKPLDLPTVVGLLLRQGFDVRTDDPVLSLAQWALEAADPPIYAAATTPPRHVLMIQGIVDNYILPRIANATSLSFRLDLAGPALDDVSDPRLEGQSPLAPLLPLVGRSSISLPASANIDGSTAVVVQHAEDGIEDGHEVAFQNDAAKQQYQCFLSTWLDGDPVVPQAGQPCP